LAYSIILNKDPDDYQFYTPQHKIGKSLNKEPCSLIQFYKIGEQEDGYKGIFHKLGRQTFDKAAIVIGLGNQLIDPKY